MTTSYDYWKRKMKMYLGSINDQVWEVTENDYAIIDPDNPTNQDRTNKQCNTMALNTIYNAIDSHPAYVLFDSGASYSFMSMGFA